jgi:hypothetical protein
MKKVFLAVLCIAITFVSCQKDEVQDPENQSIEQQFRNDANFLGKSAAANLEARRASELASACVDCDVTMTYFSEDSGGTAQVDVVDSNNNSVFSGVITTGTTYTFSINTCESYDITTQSLTGGYGNVKIKDDVVSNIIPATANAATYVDYSFKCIDDTAVEECTITVCIDVYEGTTNGTYLGVFINGSLSQFGPLQDGDCITLTVNENDTLEIRQITPGAPSNFGFFLRISTQTHNLSYPMRGFFSSTGVIPNRFFQCLE